VFQKSSDAVAPTKVLGREVPRPPARQLSRLPGDEPTAPRPAPKSDKG